MCALLTARKLPQSKHHDAEESHRSVLRTFVGQIRELVEGYSILTTVADLLAVVLHRMLGDGAPSVAGRAAAAAV